MPINEAEYMAKTDAAREAFLSLGDWFTRTDERLAALEEEVSRLRLNVAGSANTQPLV